MPKLVQLTDAEYAAQKKALANRAEEYEVTGSNGIRDCVTRDIVPPGGTVRLDPQQKTLSLLVNTGAVRKVDKPAAKAAKEG